LSRSSGPAEGQAFTTPQLPGSATKPDESTGREAEGSMGLDSEHAASKQPEEVVGNRGDRPALRVSVSAGEALHRPKGNDGQGGQFSNDSPPSMRSRTAGA